MPAQTVPIPNRSLFRHNEVCEIAQVQPYVLRSWEAEFPDLGVAKGKDGPRVYRRGDVERVLRIKHLLFVEGLTLAGARRRIQEERGERTEEDAPLETLLKHDARERILRVRQSLRELASILSRRPGAEQAAPYEAEFELAAPAPRAKRAVKPIVKSAPAKSAKRRAAAR
jgi:DNA-binding transcriptional MerR regulator